MSTVAPPEVSTATPPEVSTATPLRVLDLFSGIGGFGLGLSRAGMQTVAFCEIEEFPRRVLRKHWPDVPIYEDVRQVNADRLFSDGIGPIDIICGGVPCQPWSVAGKQAGAGDDRHLWPEMYRLVREIHPRWVVIENVPGLDDDAGLGLAGVLSNLGDEGYESVTFEIPACAVNAPHRRERIWIVAHATSPKRREEEPRRNKLHGPSSRREEGHGGSIGGSGGVAHADRSRDREHAGELPAHAAELSDRPTGGDHEPSGDGEGAVAHADHQGLEIGQSLGGDPRQECAPAQRGGAPGHWDASEYILCHDGKARRVGSAFLTLDDGISGELAGGARLLAKNVPQRVAKLKAIGNSVVPQIVERIGTAIVQATTSAPPHQP